MGVIAKQLRKKGNQQLAAAVRWQTELESAAIAEAVAAICLRLNTNFDQWSAQTSFAGRLIRGKVGDPDELHYHFAKSESGSLFVSYGRQVPVILARHSRTDVTPWRHPGYWLAEVASGPGWLTTELLLWLTDDNGKIKQRERYEQFIGELQRAI